MDTTEKNSSGNILKLFFGDPTPEENLFLCIPQREKISSGVSHNGGKPLPLHLTPEKNIKL